MSSAGMCGLERGGEIWKKIKIVKKQKKLLVKFY